MNYEHHGLKFLIIEDHPLFSEAMSMTISELYLNPIIKKSGNFQTALNILDYFAPQIIILDLNLPDIQGIDGLMRLRKRHSDCKILVVSSLADNQLIDTLIKAGASGFAHKGASREEMILALKKITQNQIYTPPNYFEPSTENAHNSKENILISLQSLTQQQSIILRLLCEGKLNRDIAEDLSIAETTVKAHLTAILRKLNVSNRTQAVLLANRVRYTDFLIDE